MPFSQRGSIYHHVSNAAVHRCWTICLLPRQECPWLPSCPSLPLLKHALSRSRTKMTRVSLSPTWCYWVRCGPPGDALGNWEVEGCDSEAGSEAQVLAEAATAAEVEVVTVAEAAAEAWALVVLVLKSQAPSSTAGLLWRSTWVLRK